MKKIIPILVMAMMLMTFVVAAPPVPAPVKLVVTLNGGGINFDQTTVTNKDTGEVLTTNEVEGLRIVNGVGLFDLSQFQQGYEAAGRIYGGDTIEIQACTISPDCATSFTIDSLLPRTVTITLIDNSVPTTTTTTLPQPPVDDDDDVVEEGAVSRVTSNSDSSSASIDAFFGQVFDVKLDNNKIVTLIDDEVNFDGETYDVKEEIFIKGTVLTSVDNEDYGLDPYINFEEGDIEYRYRFEDLVPVEDIDEEEQLEITILGKTIKIIEAGEDWIKIREGDEHFIAEGESVVASNGDTVLLKTIGEDSVLIDVNGDSEVVSLGQEKRLGEVRVLVDEILYKSYQGANNFASLIVGMDVDETVKDGDDFELFVEDEEVWSWKISFTDSKQTIGVVNQERYHDLEEEGFEPFKMGEVLYLPNDFLMVGLNGISQSDITELDFRVKDDYLEVTGSVEDTFTFGLADFEEIHVKETGFYDEDDEYITNSKLRIADSDSDIEFGSVKIGNLVIELDMSDITYNGVSLAAEDGNILDHLGMMFSDPENAIDDKRGFTLKVPDEKPEANIVFSSTGVMPVVDDDTTTTGSTGTTVPGEPTTPGTPGTTPDPEVIYVDVPGETVTVVETVEVPGETVTVTVKEKATNWVYTAFISIIALILGLLGKKYSWIKGFTAMWKKKADAAETPEERQKAIESGTKAIKTVLRKDQEGKYKKD